MKRGQYGKSVTWKECIMKKVQHKKSATRTKCNMEKVQHKKVQHEKSATWKKCNTRKAYIGNTKTWKEYNTKRVQRIVTDWNFEKNCTRAYKRITGRPLMARYTLVFDNSYRGYFCFRTPSSPNVRHFSCEFFLKLAEIV